MNILDELANKYKTDKGTIGHKYHGYTAIYYEKWKDIKDDVKKVLEIGIGGNFPATETLHASSLKMLRDFFNNATIYGIDIAESFVEKTLDMNNIEVFLCDAVNNESIINLIERIGSDFDIIIDDGSHNTIDQQRSFGYLFKYVKSGGMYIIEDLHTSIWGGFGLPSNDDKSCLSVLNNYIKNDTLESIYVDKNDLIYLNNNIKHIDVVDTNFNGASNDITSIIYKK